MIIVKLWENTQPAYQNCTFLKLVDVLYKLSYTTYHIYMHIWQMFLMDIFITVWAFRSVCFEPLLLKKERKTKEKNSYVMFVFKFLSMGILINLSSRQIADYTFRL